MEGRCEPGGDVKEEKQMKQYCPKCKQFVVKVVFGLACGCTILTGHAEEKFPAKWSLDSTQRAQVMVSSSTATGTVSVASLDDVMRWWKGDSS